MVVRLVVVAGGVAWKNRDFSTAAIQLKAGNCLHPDLMELMACCYSSHYIVFLDPDRGQETKCHLQIFAVIDRVVATLGAWEAKHEKAP